MEIKNQANWAELVEITVALADNAFDDGGMELDMAIACAVDQGEELATTLLDWPQGDEQHDEMAAIVQQALEADVNAACGL